ncbi:MAG: GDP-mannose 4,6-dehydratase [Dehalococcoidia bacterium]|nr:GDP-mannose 4,6-dehydratase [Dehalococcoidia bacterium]
MDQNGNAGSSFWQGKSVMVTGVGGFVATHLAADLADRGASVVGVLRDSRGSRRLRLFGISERIDVVHGSIEDYALIERAFNEYEVEYCFHLAAQAIVGIANRAPMSTFESNIRGTWTLMEAARHNPLLKGVVMASSDKVYGDHNVLPYTEDSPLLAKYPYDASKLCAEVLARSYAATFDLPVGVVRCANIYGGGDLNWSRVIPGTIRSMLKDEAPVIRSDGTLERDYMYVTDAVSAYVTLAENLGRDEVRGEAFNFGWGRGYSVLEIVETVLKQGGSSLRPRVLGQNKGEINRQWLDSAKANRILEWSPAVALDEGVRRSIRWYKAYLSGSQDAAKKLAAAV